jgi:hypothetical protein
VVAAKPAVYAVPVVTAAIINRANHFINVLKPKNAPRLLVAPQTFVREMSALVTVAPATAYVFLHISHPCLFYNILTFFSLTILYIVTNNKTIVNNPAKYLLLFYKKYGMIIKEPR